MNEISIPSSETGFQIACINQGFCPDCGDHLEQLVKDPVANIESYICYKCSSNWTVRRGSYKAKWLLKVLMFPSWLFHCAMRSHLPITHSWGGKKMSLTEWAARSMDMTRQMSIILWAVSLTLLSIICSLIMPR